MRSKCHWLLWKVVRIFLAEAQQCNSLFDAVPQTNVWSQKNENKSLDKNLNKDMNKNLGLTTSGNNSFDLANQFTLQHLVDYTDELHRYVGFSTFTLNRVDTSNIHLNINLCTFLFQIQF